jgi:predicted lipid-binding transport protein (Tim44 family)
MFPVIEGFPATNPFVQTIARKNGQLRINAPGFAVQGADNPMAGMMGGMGALAGMGAMAADEVSGGKAMPAMPKLEGTFTIRTSGAMRVRANNTDEGPVATTAGEVLTWRITPRTTQMPTALIELPR